jgi:sugar phosphate isomerase/epimerase
MNTRRNFLSNAAAAGAFTVLGSHSVRGQELRPEGENISFGLCTYMWGAEWDVETIIANCSSLGIKGVELRVDHAHKVSPELTPEKRKEIRAKFSEAGIEVVGMGTNAQFDSPDKAKLVDQIDVARQYVKLSHDIGGSGVKVKPNNLHEKDGVAKEVTLVQIGKALAELADYSIGFGQEIRLEVHGDVTQLADIAKIMEVANADNVRVCWNSNPSDLENGGIEKNFEAVKEKLGRTIHIHELNSGKYPYDTLAKLLVEADYEGWVLMEAASKVEDKVAALAEQKALWDALIKGARKK